jgi:hypothetical protein
MGQLVPLRRGTTTTFDQSMGGISCTNCAAGKERAATARPRTLLRPHSDPWISYIGILLLLLLLLLVVTLRKICIKRTAVETLASGTYQPESGGKNAEECLACPKGTFSNPGAAGCTECPAGTYQPYDGMAGPASCLPCQAGKCSDATGSTDCYQCCPISNLACDSYLKRAIGFYGTKQWYSNSGETGRVPKDGIGNFLVDLCARGCQMFRVGRLLYKLNSVYP